jgi:hypothetical protein
MPEPLPVPITPPPDIVVIDTRKVVAGRWQLHENYELMPTEPRLKSRGRPTTILEGQSST